jgi:hypothetical protein
MSLPGLVDVPEGLSDDNVYEFIFITFSRLQEVEPEQRLGFTDGLCFILKLVLTRAHDKAMLLYRCGLILCNPFIAVNIVALSKLMQIHSPDAISKKLRNFPSANWSHEEKQSLLHAYEKVCDVRAWSVRECPSDSVFMKFSVFRPMEQIRQMVPGINPISPTPLVPAQIVNLGNLTTRNRYRQVDVSFPPKAWRFNLHPLQVIDFSG